MTVRFSPRELYQTQKAAVGLQRFRIQVFLTDQTI